MADQLGHDLTALDKHYRHVIAEYAGKPAIDPEAEIRKARERSIAALAG